jgi:hypothetical protein
MPATVDIREESALEAASGDAHRSGVTPTGAIRD